MSWNYRVAKHVFSYKKTFVNNPKLAENVDQTLYSIIEVYYDEDGNINGYIDKKNPLANWEDYEDLKGTHELIAKAFEKPVIDLDELNEKYEQGTD